MHRICLCPATIMWIKRHLTKSARKTFAKMVERGGGRIGMTKAGRPKRSAKQRAATKKLLRWNKTHRGKRRR